MPFVRLNDTDLFFDEYGTGDPIIFIHGSLSCGMETFKKQIAYFRSKYRCICMDLRGHGKSKSVSMDSMNWTTETLSEDAIKLLDELQIECAHFVGHSMGGNVAMYCAANNPKRVKTITVISSAGMVNENITSYLEQLQPDKIDRIKFGKFIGKMQALYGDQWMNLVNHTIWNCSTYPAFSEEQLKQIKMPFLLIRGGQDEMVLDSEVEVLKKYIRDLKYYFIPSGTHFLHGNTETSEFVNQRILSFLEMDSSEGS